MENTQECQELKNIKYKSMLLSKNINYNDVDGIEKLLEEDSKKNKQEPWNKLDKTIKIKKVEDYVNEILSNKYHLNKEEQEQAKAYLVDNLEKTILKRAKDVDYVKDSGLIKDIPALQFNKITRNFTLKRCDKKQTTLKTLAISAAARKKRDRTKRDKKKKESPKNDKTKRNKKKDKIDTKSS